MNRRRVPSAHKRARSRPTVERVGRESDRRSLERACPSNPHPPKNLKRKKLAASGSSTPKLSLSEGQSATMAPSPTQVFVRVLDGSTRCLSFNRRDGDDGDDGGATDAENGHVTLGDLRRRLAQLEGVPEAEQLILCGTRMLGGGLGGGGEGGCKGGGDALPLGPLDASGYLPTCTLLLKLAGGKGGFGALLRGAANSAGTTTNFDACRDLSGRRLRHVNGEKKIIEFSKHAEERELEAIALAHINRKDLQVNPETLNPKP